MDSAMELQSAIGPAGASRPLRHLIRAVWLQALRRNEIWVVGILLGLYVLGALVLRIVGIESAQTARFVTGLGLQLGSTLTALLVIVMGARQVPDEIEQRTIYPVLAKPVSRGQVLLGKGLPTWLAGVAAMLLFTGATLAIAPRLPYQTPGPLAQALMIKAASLAMLTGLVVWLSLWMPKAVSLVLCCALYFFGATSVNLIINASGHANVVQYLGRLVPDFSLMDHFQRYVDGGGPLNGGQAAGLIVYGVAWTLVFGALAAARFRRQPI